MKKFSYVFAGSSEFALDCLKLLMKLEFLSLKGIITCPDAIKDRGKKNQVSILKSFALKQDLSYWTPEKPHEPEFLNQILQKKCDFSFVCAYGKILPEAYLQIFPKGSLNLHLSLLPRWRGAAPVQRALMAGDKRTGVCLQVMTKELDAGDIIGQRSFAITKEDNAKDVFDKSLMETKSLLREELLKYLKGEIRPQPQDHLKKTYAHKIDKKEGEIIWKDPAPTIHNKIRALFLGPQAFSFLKGQRIKIYQSKIIQENYSDFLPGEVCIAKNDQIVIACGQGALSLLEIQKEGKKRQKTADFLKGQYITLKDRFDL